MQPLLIVITTCASQEDARNIATVLVEEKLAACVNILPGVTSVYRWKGEVQQEQELVLLIKCPLEHYERCQERLLALHPYELPEIVAIQPEKGLPAYLQWVVDSCV